RLRPQRPPAQRRWRSALQGLLIRATDAPPEPAAPPEPITPRAPLNAMSRIGKQPVPIPSGVSIAEKSRRGTVKGRKGSLQLELRPEIDIKVESGKAKLAVNGSGSERTARAMHGLTRALFQNMVKGVVSGFTKELEIQGVGWNAKAQGQKLVL